MTQRPTTSLQKLLAPSHVKPGEQSSLPSQGPVWVPFPSVHRLQTGAAPSTHAPLLHAFGLQNVPPEQSAAVSHSTQAPAKLSLQNVGGSSEH
jgi:hypothetical protein